MPYYSDLGLYTSPSPTYSPYHLTGPYSNHSSIIASSFSTRPFTGPSSRTYGRYKPHLSSISENHALRRINSPKILIHSSPKYVVPKPIKINTADIDVSVNKYRKYERPVRSPLVEKEKRSSKSPSPSLEPESPSEELPVRPIRRDRQSVRLHTVYKKESPKKEPQSPAEESSSIKRSKWRQNFRAGELEPTEVRQKKTPGEKLVEKHLLKQEEHKDETKAKPKKKESLPKSPSFHDICRAISSDTINEILNPGQPETVQRKQSRQFTDEILKQVHGETKSPEEMSKGTNLERDSGRGSLKAKKKIAKKKSNEKVTIVKEESVEDDEKPHDEEARDSGRGSIKAKKKIAKKKSNETVVLPETENKSKLQRRPTLKKIRRNSTDSSLPSIAPTTAEIEQAYQDAIRDISQVEVEEIKIKPKPIITGTVNVEVSKPNLKAVIDDVKVEEVLSPKQTNKKPRFNFTIGEVEIKEKPNAIMSQKGAVHIPKAKRPVVSNVVKKRQSAKCGQILEDIKERPKKETSAKKVVEEIKDVAKKQPKEKPVMYTAEVVVNQMSTCKKPKISSTKSKAARRVAKLEMSEEEIPYIKPDENKLESDKQEMDKKPLEETPENKLNLKSARSTLKISPKPFLNIQNAEPETTKSEKDKGDNFWDAIGQRESTYYKNRKNWLESKETREPVPTIEDVANNNDVEEENKEAASAKPTSKSSLVFKKEEVKDPELQHIFSPPPTPEPKPEPEPKKEAFVPLQSNRLSQWLNPTKKGDSKDAAPLELYATPKVIRKRHYPRPRVAPAPPPQARSESESEEESEEESSEDSSDDEYDVNVVYDSGKVGASTSSNDSGFDSTVNGNKANRRNKG